LNIYFYIHYNPTTKLYRKSLIYGIRKLSVLKKVIGGEHYNTGFAYLKLSSVKYNLIIQFSDSNAFYII